MEPTCNNCTYEIDEVDEYTQYCQTCQNAYLDGKLDGIGYLKNYLDLHYMSLNQDLENLSKQMDSLDPASKDFAELDIEYNFTSGQISAVSHIIEVLNERGE